MPQIMQPARIPAGGVFEVQGMNYDSAQTFIRGAVLVPKTPASGEVVEASANPTQIVGVALQDASSAPGFLMANSPATITGRQTKISVARANLQTIFETTLTNGSSTRIAPVLADIMAQYGLTSYSGVWTIDKSKTGGLARVTIVAIDTTSGKNRVFFRFLEANLIGA